MPGSIEALQVPYGFAIDPQKDLAARLKTSIVFHTQGQYNGVARDNVANKGESMVPNRKIGRDHQAQSKDADGDKEAQIGQLGKRPVNRDI